MAANGKPLGKPDEGVYHAVFWIGIVVVAGVALATLRFANATDTSKAAAAAGVLALASALAIGIERLLEAAWTLVDSVASNPSWPFSKDADLLKQFSDQLGSFVLKPLQDTKAIVDAADNDAKFGLKSKPDVQKQVNSLLGSVNAVLGGKTDPGSWQGLTALQLGLTDLSQALSNQEVSADLNLGASTLDTLTGWVDSLTANPGRKLISLFAGCLLGLGASWLLGLDLIHAALTVAAPSGWAWGVAATGILAGLGANPTHEVIKAIQAYKEQAQQTAAPASSAGL